MRFCASDKKDGSVSADSMSVHMPLSVMGKFGISVEVSRWILRDSLFFSIDNSRQFSGYMVFRGRICTLLCLEYSLRKGCEHEEIGV